MFLSDSKIVTIGIHNIKKMIFFPFLAWTFFLFRFYYSTILTKLQVNVATSYMHWFST